MSALARRTWANLKAECLDRLGLASSATMPARVERYLESAQLDLGLLFYHPELARLDQSLTASTVNPWVSLPTDLYMVVAVVIRAAASGSIIGSLQPSGSHFVFAKYSGAAQQPTRFTRYGNKLYFDTIPKEEHSIDLYYYAYPAAPDFAASAVPDLSQLWDEHLVEYAVHKAQGAVYRPDLAEVSAQYLQTFLAGVPQRSVVELPLPERPDKRELGVQLGGPQG